MIYMLKAAAAILGVLLKLRRRFSGYDTLAASCGTALGCYAALSCKRGEKLGRHIFAPSWWRKPGWSFYCGSSRLGLSNVATSMLQTMGQAQLSHHCFKMPGKTWGVPALLQAAG